MSPDDHEPVRCRVGQRPEQHGVDEREHGRRAADDQDDGGERGRGERRLPGKHANGVADILEEALDRAPGPDGTRIFFRQRDVTERAPGRLTRAIGRQARSDLLLGLGLDMKLQLGIELGLSRVLGARGSSAGKAASAHGAWSHSDGSRTRLIARTNCSQRECSAVRCRFPAGVSW